MKQFSNCPEGVFRGAEHLALLPLLWSISDQVIVEARSSDAALHVDVSATRTLAFICALI